MPARVHLINPSNLSFGVAVITPRWLYVLAAATGTKWGDPIILDETLEPLDMNQVAKGDVVGIGIHTGNALRGYEIGRLARERGAWVVFGGIHATLFPDEVHEHGARTRSSRATATSSGRRSSPTASPARRSGSTTAGASPANSSCRRAGICCRRTATCGRRCRPCAAARSTARSARSGAPTARSRGSARSIASSGRSSSCAGSGFRFIALADDNFYPVSFEDLAMARRRADKTRLHELEALRAERFALMAQLEQLPERHRLLHADHDGSGRGPRVPRRDAARAHPRRAGRRRSGHARRA